MLWYRPPGNECRGVWLTVNCVLCVVCVAGSQGEDGPPLIYDHQMVVDEAAQRLYVVGGRVIRNPSQDPYVGGAAGGGGNRSSGDESPTSQLPVCVVRTCVRYAGVYEYNIAQATWQQLRDPVIGALVPLGMKGVYGCCC